MKLGLENISRLLSLVGDPQEHFPAVLVAGTNGKGSVTALLSSMLEARGLRVGAFYSPHLFRINERIKVDGEEVPSSDLDGTISVLKGRYGEAPFTYFEGMTAAAAIHFERKSVDIAVFEVGLGGRLDATRLVNAVMTVITGISIDHHEHLGRTKASILDEKLGIARRNVPLVASLGAKYLVEKAKRRCEELSAPFHSIRDEVEVERSSMDPDSIHLDLRTPVRSYKGLMTRMIGLPQVGNIATAVRTCELLARYDGLARPRGGAAGRRGFPVKVVREGLAHAFLPGRFQILPGDPRIILDVSHNEESLIASLRTLTSLSPRRKNVLLFAVQAHKELGRFPARAVRSAREIILAPLGTERGAKADDLEKIFNGPSAPGGAEIVTAASIGAAVRKARKRIREGDSLLIFGSHLTVEEATRHL
jgi:dihydrofolate synthase/folylpolyglutamate synthase